MTVTNWRVEPRPFAYSITVGIAVILWDCGYFGYTCQRPLIGTRLRISGQQNNNRPWVAVRHVHPVLVELSRKKIVVIVGLAVGDFRRGSFDGGDLFYAVAHFRHDEVAAGLRAAATTFLVPDAHFHRETTEQAADGRMVV
jgi:hypothetical protein